MEEEKKLNREEKKNQELIEKYGFSEYLCSPEDCRDYRLSDVSLATPTIPEAYRLEEKTEVLNQGAAGMCVSFALASALSYGELRRRKDGLCHDYSRAYIYGNREASQWQGEGMFVREALKQLHHFGDCQHLDFDMWGAYKDCQKAVESDREALNKLAQVYKIENYFHLYTQEEIKRALMQQGSVVVSIPVYKGFSKHIQMPQKGETSLGGHCMCCVGWNKEGWILQNSWGSVFGDKGCCYLPYDYPSQEWWGFTVGQNLPTPPKKTWWFKVLHAIGHGIKFCVEHIQMLWSGLTSSK